jgi:hypothetical protein
MIKCEAAPAIIEALTGKKKLKKLEPVIAEELARMTDELLARCRSQPNPQALGTVEYATKKFTRSIGLKMTTAWPLRRVLMAVRSSREVEIPLEVVLDDHIMEAKNG